MKKFASLVLALLMLAVMLPVVSLADDTNYCTIEGIDGKFDTLTAAAKAWRESKQVVTEGSTFGGHPAELTEVDAIVWSIYGTVSVGDGAGVVGSNGAGNCIFDGGYLTPSVIINKVTVTGYNNATITGDPYRVSSAAKDVTFTNITFANTMRNDSDPASLTFTNCTFKADLRIPHAKDNAALKVENCTFTGEVGGDYAIFVQGNMADVSITGNNISGYQRGMNIQTAPATVSITNNTITNLTGKAGENGTTYGSAIQLTSAASFTVTGNTIDTKNVNALHFHSAMSVDTTVTVSGNKITADYLLWNEAGLDQSKITSADNTLTIANPDKALTKTGAAEETTKIEGTVVGNATVRVPSTEETTGGQANPSTGANDVVGLAAAAAAVALIGSVAILRKK